MGDDLYVWWNQAVAGNCEERSLDKVCGGRVLGRKSARLGVGWGFFGAGEKRPLGWFAPELVQYELLVRQSFGNIGLLSGQWLRRELRRVYEPR